MDNLYVILSLQDNKEVKHMKNLGLTIGVCVIIAALAIVGAVVVSVKLGAGTTVVVALAIIGACTILDWITGGSIN
ncbi:hypothetical protein HOBO_239 [Bacillus phage Hobo]|uniref:Uncharacterized protein n=2 Tax=Caeruleovirus BM15 TaxID=1985178 RepID=A0A385E5A0_9CAUD|nr:hypothetical protein HOBO_239 [Bacillus phage Hobo]